MLFLAVSLIEKANDIFLSLFLFFPLSFIGQGNYADAISCYNEVLRIDPLAADALVNRGNTYKEVGRVNEAIQDYACAISIRPSMAEAHANLASAYKDRYVVIQLKGDILVFH